MCNINILWRYNIINSNNAQGGCASCQSAIAVALAEGGNQVGPVRVHVFDNEASGAHCPSYSLRVTDNNRLRLRLGTGCGNPNVIATSTASLPSESWVHVAGTYDAGTVRLYINGQLDSISEHPNIDPYTPLSNLWIGAQQGPHPGLSGAQRGLLRDSISPQAGQG